MYPVISLTRKQEPTETSEQPIRTRYIGHVTGYQPIRDQYFLIRSVPARKHNQNIQLTPPPHWINRTVNAMATQNALTNEHNKGVGYEVTLTISLGRSHEGFGLKKEQFKQNKYPFVVISPSCSSTQNPNEVQEAQYMADIFGEFVVNYFLRIDCLENGLKVISSIITPVIVVKISRFVVVRHEVVI
eukprot:sb/3471304/